MLNEFSAAFEAELTTVGRAIDPPTGHPGWGSDLACSDDLTPEMTERPGDDPMVVAEYVFRRISTPPGELPDDPDWGVSIRGRLSSAMGVADLRELQSEILGEVARDDRLRDVVVSAKFSQKTETLEIAIRFEIVDSSNVFLLTIVADKTGSRLAEVVVNGQSAN